MKTALVPAPVNLKHILCYAGFFSFLAFTPSGAMAAVCSVPAMGSTDNISADCTSLNISNNSVTVNNSAVITGTGDAPITLMQAAYNTQIINTGSIASSAGVTADIDNSARSSSGYYGITSLTNSGTISSYYSTIYNENALATIGSITNTGTISADTSVAWSRAIGNGSNGIPATINSITNGDVGGTTSLISGQVGIYSFGTINTITNYNGGTISGTVRPGVANYGHGTLGMLTNSGHISGQDAISNVDHASITTITNNATGSVTGVSSGINNQLTSSIGTITNAGTISQSGYSGSYGAIVNTGSTIDTITNSGTLQGNSNGIYNTDSGAVIKTITNTSSGIIGDANNTMSGGIQNNTDATIGDALHPLTSGISNSGTIAGSQSGIGNAGTIIAIVNNAGGTITSGQNGVDNENVLAYLVNLSGGTISGASFGLMNGGAGAIGSSSNSDPMETGIINAGTISGAYLGILNLGSISGVYNTGTITGTSTGTDYASAWNRGAAAFSNTGTVAEIVNLGTILGGAYGTGILNNDGNQPASTGGTISILSNFGTITTASHGYGINNVLGTITTFNNSQGGSSPVTYTGVLPTNYNIAIASPSSYGKLAATNITGSMHFGIFGTVTAGYLAGSTAASSLASTTYTSVLTGISASNLLDTTGTYGGYTWTLQEIGTSSVWDLVVAAATGGGGSSGGGSASSFAAVSSLVPGGNARNVGAVLDQIQGNSAFSPVLSALTTLGSGSAQAEANAIQQLAPSQLTPQLVGANLSVNQTAQVIGAHQEGLLAQNGSHVGKAAGTEYQRGAFWGQLIGGVAFKNNATDAGGYKQSYYGLAVGADNHVSKETIVGGAISWVKSGATGSGLLEGSKTSADNIQVSAYGTQRFGSAYVNALVGVGVNLFDQSRTIAFLGETAKADYLGLQYTGKIDAGWDFDLQPYTVTPMVGFQAVHMANNGYTETGSSANVSVKEQGVSSYTTTIGAKVASVIKTDLGVMTPEVKLSWAHDLRSGPIVTSASMGGVGFTTSTPRAAADAAQVTLATGLKLDDAFSLRAEYNGDIRADYNSHTGLVKVLWNY